MAEARPSPGGGLPASGIAICRLELGPLANFIYLVADPEARECVVVDPAWDVPAILEAASSRGWRVAAAVVTHHHPDHVNGVGPLLKAADVPVYVHREDAFALRAFGGNVRPSRGGDSFTVGRLSVELLHTPGHTEGSQCLMVQDHLLSGDTLFIGGCGRVDLPHSDPEKMYRSLKRLARLPDPTQVMPGHNYGSSPCAPLGSEKRSNPYLHASARRGLADFLSLIGS